MAKGDTKTIRSTDEEGNAIEQTVEVIEEVKLTNLDVVKSTISGVLTERGGFSEDLIDDLTTLIAESLDTQELIA